MRKNIKKIFVTNRIFRHIYTEEKIKTITLTETGWLLCVLHGGADNVQKYYLTPIIANVKIKEEESI